MQISNNFSVSGVDATRASERSNASKPQTNPGSPSGIEMPNDLLDLSPEALAVGNPPASETFRADRVAELRQAIAEGNYDTDEKLTEALSRMLDRLA
ncbi:MAG: flagellar biosynthesis anti-sigma factor FlgM [Planctomycetota bacterium]|jgi:anti-sigma28 factor (negative regulator of flagellin synthesis)